MPDYHAMQRRIKRLEFALRLARNTLRIVSDVLCGRIDALRKAGLGMWETERHIDLIRNTVEEIDKGLK